MPARGKVRSWIFEDITGISSGLTTSDPGGAWLWLSNVKTWSAVVGSTDYTAEEAAGLAMVLKL